jgi:hypothetical protein
VTTIDSAGDAGNAIVELDAFPATLDAPAADIAPSMATGRISTDRIMS